MHLFLTGPKRVGKSTLVNAILAAWPGRVGGFRTLRLNTWLPGRYTVHLLPPGDSQEPGEENLLFVCGEPGQDVVSRFARLGCQALSGSGEATLLLMDELGPHEGEAIVFQQAVFSALDGNEPILGVLQQADSPFLEAIARHPNVNVLEVTEENRNALAGRISEWIQILTKG